ncbi:hypothetical protein ACJRO7_023996 [Eucalyptus globulus]|uniref:Uncharacterized protein n=1 Tax=Eucalyptus globulus TaxID=34317 RepID=A0ABD3K422_EUCGL
MLDKTALLPRQGLRPGPTNPTQRPLHFRLLNNRYSRFHAPPYFPIFSPAPRRYYRDDRPPPGPRRGRSRHFATSPTRPRATVNRSTAGKRSLAQVSRTLAVSHNAGERKPPVRRGNAALAGSASSGFIEPHQ